MGWFGGALRLVFGRFGRPPGGVTARPGGALRRRGPDLNRVLYRRGPDLTRALKGYDRMAETIQRTTVVKDAGETVSYVADFSAFPEAVAEETLASPSVPAVSGLTIGSPAVTAEGRDYVPAGYGVEFTVSGGTAGTTYVVEVFGTFSGGGVRVVKANVVVE